MPGMSMPGISGFCFCERRVFGLVLCNFSFITNLSSENPPKLPSHPQQLSSSSIGAQSFPGGFCCFNKKTWESVNLLGKFGSLSEILPLNRAFSRRLCVFNQISHPSTYFFISPGVCGNLSRCLATSSIDFPIYKQ